MTSDTGSKVPLSPRQRYEQDLKQAGFQRDSAQELAIEHLQRLHDALIEVEAAADRPLVKLRRKLRRGFESPVKGLYFWGGVGRGKTYLMDCFYEALPFQRKLRIHFHRFMQRVHRELT